MIEAVGTWVVRFDPDARPEALLVRRATTVHRGEWFTVDGLLEPDESPRAGARRELLEETTLTPRFLLDDAATPQRITTARGDVWLHGFVAYVEPTASVVLNSEHTEWCWSPFERALHAVPLSSQRTSLRRIARRLHTHDPAGLLDATNARQIPHPGGTLHAHLERTANLLSSFGARPALRTAGLLHALYGTDGFPHALTPLTDRALISALLGAETENLIYLYAACDRHELHAALQNGRPSYRDRLQGGHRTLTADELRDLVELTFANELDLARHDTSFRSATAHKLVPLLRACRNFASAQAYACFEATYDNSTPNHPGEIAR